MAKPICVGDVIAADRTFARDNRGFPVTRQRVCLCGKEYTQRLLSERFLEIVEAAGEGARRAMQRDVPDMFVPVHCPSCERVDLGRVPTLKYLPREHEYAAD